MILLLLGLALWSVVHLLPVAAPARRAAYAEKLGAGPYKAVAAVLLVASVVLMVRGYQAAEIVDLWFPPAWTVHLNNLLMLLAFIVFTAGHARAGLRRLIRHPQLAGVKIWAFAHLLVNGDLASVVLFGGLLAWAVVSMILINRRDGAWLRPPETPRIRDVLHVAVSLAVFAAVAFVHAWLGVRPFPG